VWRALRVSPFLELSWGLLCALRPVNPDHNLKVEVF